MSSTPVLDHLLRTMAAVSPEQRVLVLGASGDWVEPLVRLGFEVHACTPTEAAARCVMEAVEGSDRAGRAYAAAAAPGAAPYPEAHFGWVVARCLAGGGGAEDRSPEQGERLSVEKLLAVRLAEAQRLVRPGGWIFTVAAPAFTPEALGQSAMQAGLAEAEAPSRAEEKEEQAAAEAQTAALRAIYRRVEEGTPP